jgi:hypothetical protein
LRKYFVMLLFALTLISNIGIMNSIFIYGQGSEITNVTSTKNSESFNVSFNSSNTDIKNPVVHSFSKPIPTNWQIIIQNNLSYFSSPNAKTIIRILEPPPSEKFIELGMFGGNSSKFWAAVNTRDSGYIRVYERSTDGWSRDQPIFVAHANNQGLTITNGKRIIIDRLSINDFLLNAIEVYGKDRPEDPSNSFSGYISFNIIYGNPSDSPIYYVPLVMLILVGGILIILLLKKKRDSYS